MILARAGHICLVTGLMVFAVEAQAGVLQIDSEGARWVTGPMANETPSNPTLENGAVDLESIVVPDQAVADTRRHATSIPSTYTDKVNELAARFDLSPSLIEAVVWQESRWRENAVSHAGARGLAQLMPATAKYLGVDPDDPMANLEGGARYLREQLDRFDGNLEKALAAYNAGPGRVERAGGIPNIRETKQYVAAIMGRLAGHSRPME